MNVKDKVLLHSVQDRAKCWSVKDKIGQDLFRWRPYLPRCLLFCFFSCVLVLVLVVNVVVVAVVVVLVLVLVDVVLLLVLRVFILVF